MTAWVGIEAVWVATLMINKNNVIGRTTPEKVVLPFLNINQSDNIQIITGKGYKTGQYISSAITKRAIINFMTV